MLAVDIMSIPELSHTEFSAQILIPVFDLLREVWAVSPCSTAYQVGPVGAPTFCCCIPCVVVIVTVCGFFLPFPFWVDIRLEHLYDCSATPPNSPWGITSPILMTSNSHSLVEKQLLSHFHHFGNLVSTFVVFRVECTPELQWLVFDLSLSLHKKESYSFVICYLFSVWSLSVCRRWVRLLFLIL